MIPRALASAEDGPPSEVRPKVVNAKLSERLWGLDWSRHLPWTFAGVAVEEGRSADALRFVAEHYRNIFGDGGDRFLCEEMTVAKRRFWEEMDIFLFAFEGRTVGICAGHPSDWSTYYIRTFAILPEFRERGFAASFARASCLALADAGVSRYEADCSPANTAMMRLFSSDGFLVTATMNSERWGTMLRFTKFLREDAATAYRQQFIYVPAFGRDAERK